MFLLDSMGGGAWPFLVGGVVCLVNFVNERDLDLLNNSTWPRPCRKFLRGTLLAECNEVLVNDRSVMPFAVPGRTRATLMYALRHMRHPEWIMQSQECTS